MFEARGFGEDNNWSGAISLEARYVLRGGKKLNRCFGLGADVQVFLKYLASTPKLPRTDYIAYTHLRRRKTKFSLEQKPEDSTDRLMKCLLYWSQYSP